MIRVRTDLGAIRIEADEEGILSVDLGDTAKGNLSPSRGPAARHEKRAARLIRTHLAGESASGGALARIPISPRAFPSSWSKQVLAIVRRIPLGETATYGEIARAVGRPRAARAVGAALRGNPCPLLIPCHRVVAASGDGGFTAGGRSRPDLKRRLLAYETH